MLKIVEIIENGEKCCIKRNVEWKCWFRYKLLRMQKMLKITKIVENGENNVGVGKFLNEIVGFDINC